MPAISPDSRLSTATPQRAARLETPPLALYVHLPWCVRKCPYCDFNSHALRGALPEREYLAALLRDLEQDLPRVSGRTIETIFFGGGTPSLFSPEGLGRLLGQIRARIVVAAGAEITLEANPGAVEHGRLAEYRAAGITRLSLGVQSFGDQQLALLGRIHSASEAIRAVEEARAAGFDNVNLDLMFGLPRQNPEQALADVERAVALAPAHISHYQLTLEPNTLFYARPPPLPDEEAVWEMQQRCQTRLAQAGYGQYEISAYARPGKQCRHNLNYWRFGDYLGIGAGAHGKLSDAATGGIFRTWKIRHPAAYLQAAGSRAALGGVRTLPPADRVFEFMLNRLRLKEGFTPQIFEAATGVAFSEVQEPLQEAMAAGLIELTDGQYRPSPHGYLYLNDLQARFLPEPGEAPQPSRPGLNLPQQRV